MISLRLAQPQDSAALLDIYRPYVLETSVTFETEPPTEEEFRGRILEFTKKFPYILAEEDGTVLGYAYAHAFHERAAYGWTVETSVYVHRDLRRSHVGKKLYTALLALLRLQGVRNVCAVVAFPNDASMAFHKAMGFEVGGLLPDFGYKQGAWHTVAYLYQALGSGDPAPLVPVGALTPQQVAEILQKAGTIS